MRIPTVIPAERKQGPESIATTFSVSLDPSFKRFACDYGFRARACGVPPE
jgi:hypothetical protein